LSDFDAAFDALIGHEGGYVNDPRDPGGETNWGISKRSYPAVNIKALTRDGAKAIYKRDFWDKVRGDELPYPVAFNLFDGAVNSGVIRSIMWMQAAAGVADDGKFGPITLGAILAADPDRLAARYNGLRLKFMTDLSTWPTFGKGWARRIAANLGAS
jgi:lysozyme family protein